MKTIDLSPSQYRVVQVTVECSSARSVECSSAVPSAVPVSSTARASRMSQSQATVPTATLTNTKRTTTHPIYGIVNLALLAVIIYLLWANLI